MSNTYGTIITTKGAAIIADCIVNGGQLVISEAAAGDGNGAYYQPTVNQEHLVHECWRGEIAAAERNTPDTEKVAISGGVSGKLTMVMHIIVADASVVEFTINPSLDTVSQEELNEAIALHNASGSSHADIRLLALNSMQVGDAYTKEESDARIASGVSTHNANTEAHPSILSGISGLDSRLTTLELKYGTNVTGNSFSISFANLTGLVVTGVWNKNYARIEF